MTEPQGLAPEPETTPPEPQTDEPLPTLQDEFAVLTPALQQSVFGKPAQMVTGLLIGALMLVGLLIGLTTLAKSGPAGAASPVPVVSPSGIVRQGRCA